MAFLIPLDHLLSVTRDSSQSDQPRNRLKKYKRLDPEEETVEALRSLRTSWQAKTQPVWQRWIRNLRRSVSTYSSWIKSLGGTGIFEYAQVCRCTSQDMSILSYPTIERGRVIIALKCPNSADKITVLEGKPDAHHLLWKYLGHSKHGFAGQSGIERGKSWRCGKC